MSPGRAAVASAFEVQQSKRQRKVKTSIKTNKLKKAKFFNVKNIAKKLAVSRGKPVKVKELERKKNKKRINGTKKAIEVDEPEICPDVMVVEDNNEQLSVYDSISEGEKSFEWLISPITAEDFFRNAWEKTPLYVKRSSAPDYFKNVLSSEKINTILQNNYILFSKNIDITSYHNGVRETHNPNGRATSPVVWDFYKKGCSMRMLNPQTFSPELGLLNASLQEYFGCFVGANSYLTPAGSQGFAPHYDDIEAFVLQIEGRKHWKIYTPRHQNEILPRYSSENFSQEEIGTPIMEVTLSAGDLLYFPRGFIHQAHTDENEHSLHITLSCYQKNTWGDFLEKLVPAALAVAIEEDVDYRRGLPKDYLSHLGVANSDKETPERTAALLKIEKLLGRLIKYSPVDAAADQLGKNFMHDALPPILSSEEKKRSVFGQHLTLGENGKVNGNVALTGRTKVKLVRAHILRLVKEDSSDDTVQVYHSVDNSWEYHGEEPQMFEVSTESAAAIEHLVHAYPLYVQVNTFPLETQEKKVELATQLWMKGLLLTETPVPQTK